MKDKNVIINAAQRFAARGQIDKAIAEWEKLLKERDDGNLHNTIGDLYLKQGAEQKARDSYTQAAKIFKKDGFYPKAIALYKKILNIMPNDVDSLLALARLNADRGLTGNAIENYYRAAEIYNKNGSAEKATQVADRMLQLSPADAGTRSKIAYLYFRIGLRERASNEYVSIAESYFESDNAKRAKEFFDKAIEVDPGNVSALLGLSKLAMMAKNHDEALTILENALSREPQNKELLLTHARLAVEMGKKDVAMKTLALLGEIDPSSRDRKTLLGILHLREGMHENAWDELLPVIDDELDSERWDEARELLQHFKDLYPLPVQQRQVRICRAQGDSAATGQALKELADLHEREGSQEEALALYKDAMSVCPDDCSLKDKVQHMEGLLRSTAEPDVISPDSNGGYEAPLTAMPEYNEVTSPETYFSPLSNQGTSPEQVEQRPSDAENLSPVDIPPVIAQSEKDVSQGDEPTGEHIINYPDSEAPVSAAKGRNDMPSGVPPEDNATLHESLPDSAMPDPESNNITVQSHRNPEDPSSHQMPVPSAPEPESPAASDHQTDAQGTPSDSSYFVKKAEADFYLQQGLDDEAIRIYEQLLAAFPEKEEISRTLSSLKSTAPVKDPVPVEVMEEQTPESAATSEDDLQELFAQFEKPGEETVDYEAHYLAGLELKQKGHIDNALKELQIAAKDPGRKARNMTMLALCYMEQKSYPLAIEAFTQVLETMSPADSTYLHVKYELAHAYMSEQDCSRALEHFREVQSLNPGFKDVSDKVSALTAQLPQAQKPLKKDRVSYI